MASSPCPRFGLTVSAAPASLSPAALLGAALLGAGPLGAGLLGADLAAQAAPQPAPAAASAVAPAPARLTIDKLLDWESVSAPRIAPDGETIVFTRTWVDKVGDRRRPELWIMARDGSHPRFLAKGSGPRWSPDGTRIAFAADGEPKGRQLHVLYLPDRSITQITHTEEAPSSWRWSPDGKLLAFQMQVPEADPFPIKLPERPKGAKWAPTPRIITRLNYRRDRSGYAPKGFRHLFVVEATGGTPRQITHGDFNHGAPTWHPGGGHLYFSGLRTDDAPWQVRESEIYRVGIADRKIERLTERAGVDANPAISPDGKWIAYLVAPKNQDTYNITDIQVASLVGADGGVLKPTRRLRMDRQPRDLTWSADSQSLYATYRSRGESHLFRFDANATGEPEQLTRGPVNFRLGDIGRDGTLIGTRSSAHEPGDLWAKPAGKDWQRLTRVHADVLLGIELGAVEEVRYRSHGDLEIQGWLVKPPGFDPEKKYPLILQIHGGPHGMYGVDFSFERQNHAAAGYLVLYTNPRGSLGYGKEFGNAINNAYPGHDYDDLMRGVDAVIAKGFVDEKNLFVYGGSGGGVLTAWIVGHTNRFAAAVSMFPVINWISFVGTTDGPYWYTNFKQLPWEGIEEHWERSPLRHVGNVETPTMLLTGELDLRTPMAQTEEFYQALKLRKVDTMMIRVPDEYHGAAGRHVSNQLRRILYVRKWFERYRTPPVAVEATGKKPK